MRYMAVVPLVKPPEPLNLKDTTHLGGQWKQFKQDWMYYETTLKINKGEGLVQVVLLLNVIRKDAWPGDV